MNTQPSVSSSGKDTRREATSLPYTPPKLEPLGDATSVFGQVIALSDPIIFDPEFP